MVGGIIIKDRDFKVEILHMIEISDTHNTVFSKVTYFLSSYVNRLNNNAYFISFSIFLSRSGYVTLSKKINLKNEEQLGAYKRFNFTSS